MADLPSGEVASPVEVAIALGGNLGDRHAHLRRGVAALPPAVLVRRLSPLYESAPWGVSDQPAFLNAVLLAETALAPLALLDCLKAIERAAGREQGPLWGPRPLDLDILLYGDAIIREERLTVPHPRMAERNFVLRPLADLDRDRVPPGWSHSVGQALAEIGREGLRRVAGPRWAIAGDDPIPA